jgi:hypothetical protein
VARSEARVSVDIWAPESDFTALTAGGQRLYLFLLSQPDLSHLGVLALRSRRWARAAADLTADDVQTALNELEKHRYVVTDYEAEELFVRSFVRRDKVYRQPNVLRAAADHLALVTSPLLRQALAVELRRIEAMEMPATSAEIVSEMLAALGDGPTPGDDTRSSMPEGDDERSSMSPEGDDERPSMSPDDGGSGNPSAKHAPGTTGDRGGLRSYVGDSPSPEPLAPNPEPRETPSASPNARKPRGESRGTRLPDGFSVTDDMKNWAREHTPLAGMVDHEMFLDHWRSQSGQRAVKRDWVAAWRNWMRRVQENKSRFAPRQPAARSTTDERVAQALDVGRRLQAIHDQKAVGQ